MDSPQITLRNRVHQILGPSRDNSLCWVKFPVLSGYQYELGCWIGDIRGLMPATHGIACCIDGMAQYASGRYSPSQRRVSAQCGLTLDLWLPEDLNKETSAQEATALTGQGKPIPVVLESMDNAAQLLLGAIKDLSIVQSVRMSPPVQRGVYDNSPTLERVRINVQFCPEMCIEERIA